MMCHSAQIRAEDALAPRGVPEPHRADNGVLFRTQARDLPHYGIPVPFDPIHDLAQTRFILRAPARAALVGIPRLSQVVKADVDRDDFSPTQRLRNSGSFRSEWSSWVLVWPLSPRLMTLRRAPVSLC